MITLCLAFSTVGCGKYGPPTPPELLSPKAVGDLVVTSQTNGVKFAWKAPDVDRRGEELKSIDGYNVERKLVEKPSDISDEEVEYVELKHLPDTHLADLEKRKEEARAKGLSTRQVKVDPLLKNFEFVDEGVQPGKTYVYRITPMNQTGVKGEVAQVVHVVFRGDASTIHLLPSSSLDDDAFLWRYE